MRYLTIAPVNGGYAFWDVIDTKSEVMPNFVIAALSIHAPNAEKEAKELAKKWNKGEKE